MSEKWTSVYHDGSGSSPLYTVRLCSAGDLSSAELKEMGLEQIETHLIYPKRFVVGEFHYFSGSVNKRIYKIVYYEAHHFAEEAIKEIVKLPRWVWRQHDKERDIIIRGSLPWATDFDKVQLHAWLYKMSLYEQKCIPTPVLPDDR